MDTVTMLRDLWRHRYAFAGALLLSVLVSTLVLYEVSPPLQLESRKYQVGVATTSVLIDTPSSQVAAIAPQGTEQLGMRADLLSRLMVDGAMKAEIAKAAGLHPDALFGVSMSATDQPASVAPPRGAPSLTTRVVTNNDGTQLPLIQIEAQAIDAASAAKLADAAVEGLRGYVDDQAADTQVPDQRRVRVSRVGATQAETAVRGPSSIVAVAVGMFLFGLGCLCILGLAALVRTWRSVIATERRLSDNDVAWLAKKQVGGQEGEPPVAVAASPLRPAEPMRPIAAGQPAPLRPADGARSATEPAQEDHPYVAGPQANPRARGQRRRSAS